VDDTTPDGDTTRVTSSIPGQVDLYEIANLPAGTTVIRSVRVTAVARVPTPCEDISCWGDIRLRVNGFESPAFSVASGIVYGARSYTWSTNPSTGKAWTEAEVNALQAGMKLEATNWFVHVTQVYVTVEVEPFLLAYDAASRPTQIVDPEGRVTAYTYDGDSRRAAVKHPNNVWTNTTYDDADRTSSAYTNKSGNAVIESFAYTYDKAGNRLTMKEGTATTSYEYDKLHRLVKEITPSGFTTTYKYDKVGNRVQKISGGMTTDYIYDADDRLTQERIQPLGWILLYEYDRNGNLVRDFDELGNPGLYTYDHENRLTRLHYPNSGYTCSWTYFPNGARASSSCSPATYYAYDFFGGGGYEDVVAEYDSAGTRQARYTHGPGADEPIGMLRGGSYCAYHTDALGSVTRLTDAGQASAGTYRYDGWGGTTTESGTVSNPFRFTGREKLSGSPLYHYRARTYDPDVGRFLSKDPSGMADGPNAYAYVGNNPVNWIDPSGLRGCKGRGCGSGGPPAGGGNGPTCPPGRQGRGNAHGHCRGELRPPPPSEPAAKKFNKFNFYAMVAAVAVCIIVAALFVGAIYATVWGSGAASVAAAIAADALIALHIAEYLILLLALAAWCFGLVLILWESVWS
jgi:RHS repeat-associated protein